MPWFPRSAFVGNYSRLSTVRLIIDDLLLFIATLIDLSLRHHFYVKKHVGNFLWSRNLLKIICLDKVNFVVKFYSAVMKMEFDCLSKKTYQIWINEQKFPHLQTLKQYWTMSLRLVTKVSQYNYVLAQSVYMCT